MIALNRILAYGALVGAFLDFKNALLWVQIAIYFMLVAIFEQNQEKNK